MKFQQLFNLESPIYQIDGYPTTLFPEDCPDEIKNQIMCEFFNYDLAISPPWVWVQRFHLVIERHLYQWEKLIASEKYLRDEDGIYNYDLKEESTSSGSHSTSNTGTGQNNQFVSDTPDGSLTDIENYMSSGAREIGESQSSSSGTSLNSGNMRRYGNIGVMTSAQILGGYREAINYDAFQTIFREIQHLFIGCFDLDDNGSFDLVVNPVSEVF